MDTTFITKKEPVFIKVEPSSVVPEIIPVADNVKLEDTPNISFESSVPMIKEEMGNSYSVTEIAPDIKSFEEDGNEVMQEETQKLEGGYESSLSNDVKSSITIEEHAIGSQQSVDHSLPYNSTESSSSLCKEVNAACGSLEELTPLHFKDRFACDLCGNTFANPKSLKTHGKVHTGERPYPCDECGFSFKEKYTLYRHMRGHNKDHTISKSYPCRGCSRSFSSNTSLKLHKLFCASVTSPPCSATTCTDTNNEKTPMPVNCIICGKSFQKESYLKHHMVCHSDNRPYTCNECGQGFKSRKGILIHVGIHSHIKKYICKICGKKFGGSGALIQHKLSHSDHRNFNCNECGKAFKMKKDIINHLVIHSNTRPFICEVCGFAGKRKLQLSLHKTSHSTERPYSCPTCGKTFKHQLYLNRHKKDHITLQS